MITENFSDRSGRVRPPPWVVLGAAPWIVSASSVAAEYQKLASRDEVQSDLEALKASGDEVKLGPSDQFRAKLRGLAEAEQELKATRASAETQRRSK